MEEPRIIAGYVIEQTFTIGGKDIVLGINEQMDDPYMVCTVTYDNPLNVPWPTHGMASGDYLEMVEDYIGRIRQETEELRNIKTMRRERGVTGEILTQADCVPDSRYGDYTGQALVLNPSRLSPEYRDSSNQLLYATHGNGCRPDARGQSVFAKNIYTGKSERWSRSSVLGVILPERMPDWAKERLADIQKPEQDKKRLMPER